MENRLYILANLHVLKIQHPQEIQKNYLFHSQEHLQIKNNKKSNPILEYLSTSILQKLLQINEITHAIIRCFIRLKNNSQ